jgi:hypothetical protein
VLDKSLGDDRRHEFVRAVDALAPMEAQRKRDGVGEVFRRGWGVRRSWAFGMAGRYRSDENKTRTRRVAASTRWRRCVGLPLNKALIRKLCRRRVGCSGLDDLFGLAPTTRKRVWVAPARVR